MGELITIKPVINLSQAFTLAAQLVFDALGFFTELEPSKRALK